MRFERHISFTKIIAEFKKILWDITILWQHIIFISKDLAIIYKCYIDCLQSRKYCKAIMDDILLFTPSKKSHLAKLEDLLEALLKNGCNISPKKCQLFRTELQYMGNTIFMKT